MIGGVEVKAPPKDRSNAYDPKWASLTEAPTVHADVKIEIKAPPTEHTLQEDREHTGLIRPVHDPWASLPSASMPQPKVGLHPPSKAQLTFASTELRSPKVLPFARVREAELHDVKAPPPNFIHRIRLADHVVQSDPQIQFASASAERMVQTFQQAYKEDMLAHLLPIIRKTVSDRQKAQGASVCKRPKISLANDVSVQLDEWLQNRAKAFAAQCTDPMRVDDGTVVQPSFEELWQEWNATRLNSFTKNWVDGTVPSLHAQQTTYQSTADVQRDRGPYVHF